MLLASRRCTGVVASARAARACAPVTSVDGMSTPLHVAASAELAAPADRVWAIVADYRHDVRWREGVVAMQQDTPGLVVDGTVTTERFAMLGTRTTNLARISRVASGTSFAWTTFQGVTAHGTRTVTALSSGWSRVDLHTFYTPRGPERLIAPIIRRALSASLARSVERLAALV